MNILKPKQSDGRDMENEKIPVLILRFALPATVGMIAGAIYNIVDRVFVGHIVGPAGLAAITVAFPVMMLMFSCSLMIGVGGSTRVAILRGAKKQRQAEQALGQSIMLLLLFGFVGIAAGLTSVDTLLKITGASNEIMPLARDYLKTILIGGPLALMGYAFNSLIRSCGNPHYAMGTQMFGALSNVFLDWLFIAHMGMGVYGAALGTVIAQGLATLAGVAYFFSKKTPLRIRLYFILKPVPSVIKKICAIGSAPFLLQVSFVLFMTLVNRSMHQYGGDTALSALGIFFSLDSLLFMPGMAMGEAVQPITGYNYGAGKPDRVIETIKSALKLTITFYTISLLFSEIFAEWLISLFTKSPEVIAIGVPGMRLSYMGIVFFGITAVTNSALQGVGKARESIALSLLRHVLFMFIPLFILPPIIGLWGIWATFALGDMLGGTLSFFFLRRLIKWLRSPDAYRIT